MANSGGEAIALDTDAQAQLAAQWEEYADAVEASGQPPVQPEALREQLGAIYEPFVQAKASENLARQRTKYGQCCRQSRLQHPSPEGHGHHAEGKARKPLHKACDHRTQGHDEINRFHEPLHILVLGNAGNSVSMS